MFYKIITMEPAIIRIVPKRIFQVITSCNIKVESIMAVATLILSTGATCDTFAKFNGLK